MTEPKKMGRPPKPEAERRQQIGVRTSPELKEDLERAAATNGRSLAQEAELRLVQSFQEEGRLGGAATYTFLQSLVGEIARVERHTGKSWLEDVATYSAVRIRTDFVIADARPPMLNSTAFVTAALAMEEARANTNASLKYLVDRKVIASGLAMPSTSGTHDLGMFGNGTGERDRSEADNPRLGERLLSSTKAKGADARETKYDAPLRAYGHHLLIDPCASPSTWRIFGREGDDLTEREAAAILGMLDSFMEDAAREADARKAYDAALAPFLAEEEKGKAVAKALSLTSTLRVS